MGLHSSRGSGPKMKEPKAQRVWRQCGREPQRERGGTRAPGRPVWRSCLCRDWKEVRVSGLGRAAQAEGRLCKGPRAGEPVWPLGTAGQGRDRASSGFRFYSLWGGSHSRSDGLSLTALENRQVGSDDQEAGRRLGGCSGELYNGWCVMRRCGNIQWVEPAGLAASVYGGEVTERG